MYTGYFALLKHYDAAGLVPVAICGKVPEWYNGTRYSALAPRYGFFHEWKDGSHRGDNDWYVERFHDEVLSQLVPQKVLDDLKEMCPDLDRIVLLCYEKPSDFCHRHLVAKWFRDNGTNCTEYIPEIEFRGSEFI